MVCCVCAANLDDGTSEYQFTKEERVKDSLRPLILGIDSSTSGINPQMWP
jgi:hypothetical protein